MRYFLSLALTLIFVDVKAQAKLEIQVGGSNVAGITINSAYDISLGKNPHVLTPYFGIGMIVPIWLEPSSIIHVGLDYHYKNCGLGTELSGFATNPFITSDNTNDFVDLVVYPNISYTFGKHSNWYYKITAGAYFAFSKYYNSQVQKTKMEFEGDVFPGIGFTIGYKLIKTVPNNSSSRHGGI